MMSFYWMNVLGKISACCCIVGIISIIATIVAFLLIDIEDLEDYKSKFIGLIIATSISLLGSIFIPSTETLMKIYVVDNVVEYIESNDKARELPDKVIECCYKLMDEYLNEDNNE